MDYILKRKGQNILVFVIFIVSIGIKSILISNDLPLVIDGMDNFTYSTAINFYGQLPTEWSPPNNGWPIFVSFWFSLINLENTLEYMQMQKIISVILSSLIIIPVYFLCRKFFDEKISLVGTAFFAFDPRIILNSTLGITEPLFILLGITSLVIFLKYERRSIFLSFILVSLCTIVRAEGIFLFLTLSILFFIEYKFSKQILKTYLPCLVIFILILLPIMDYRMEVSGNDAIFQRVAHGTNEVFIASNESQGTKIVEGIELFIKYLGWIMIPNFLIFLPLGFILFLKERRKETKFIIIFLISSSIPIFYAYISQAQDTRYLYFLYPIFSLISLFSVKFFLSKTHKKNLVLTLMIIGIFSASIGFYNFQYNNFEKENELNDIAEIVVTEVSGLNFHPSETRYIRAAQLPTEWPFLFFDEDFKIKSISTKNYDNLEEFIQDSKENLTHIIVDDDEKLPKFLKEVYFEEEKFVYLEKVFDSKDSGFKHHVKLFKINFEKFEKQMN